MLTATAGTSVTILTSKPAEYEPGRHLPRMMLSSFLPGRPPPQCERLHPRIRVIVEHFRLDTQRGRHTCQSASRLTRCLQRPHEVVARLCHARINCTQIS